MVVASSDAAGGRCIQRQRKGKGKEDIAGMEAIEAVVPEATQAAATASVGHGCGGGEF